MTNDFPSHTMACAPFLQRLGLERIRPRQNAAFDLAALQSQRTPVPYPIQHVEHMPASRIPEPLHGTAELWPWSERDILIHINPLRSRKRPS